MMSIKYFRLCWYFLFAVQTLTILQSPAVSQDHDHGSEPEAESERYQLSIPSIKKCRDFPEFNFNLSAGCHLEIEKDEHGCTKSTRIKCDENVTLKVDCDENEEFKECGNCNEKQCGDPESSTPSDQIACDESPCFPKCQCLESFVRNEENKCVKSAQCPKIAKDRCKLRPDSGFCRNKFERYFYNQQKKSCEKFFWGGCGGNENQFSTLEECQKTCS